MMNLTKWNIRFLRLAREIATWSLDPSKQIGSVAIGDDRRILSTGYNGFPRGIQDSDYRLSRREAKYKYIVHSEMNCIYNACHNGISLLGSTLYVWGLPVCDECAKGVIQAGIREVFCGLPTDHQNGPWDERFKLTQEMFTEVGIPVHVIRQSLDLQQ